ncbi:MAG: PEGA domain-containing protein [Bacteroidales bacterium]|nr:PEGA domain-containing protein [Clostridium sp.]MCM1204337.1 PEGA domain-containing protein [Bacteroidales bacterium]
MKILRMRPSGRITLSCFAILLLFGLCFGITGCGREITLPSYDEEVEPAEEVSLFAIVCNVDEVNEKITLRTVNYTTEVTLSFNGGTDVKDKYGDILSMSQVSLGCLVDAVYDANREKLLSLQISGDDNIRKLQEVSGAVIDYAEETVKIAGTVYKMNSNISAFSDNTEIGINEVCSEDQLTVWMYNDVVCSVYVELGHGYVKLSDFASYIGGMVEIGYDVIVPVTEDMLLTVREGKYTLRIEKGDDVGTKAVEVIKNQEINVSLADIAIQPKQIGSVLFKVTPADAAVYVDGKRVNTEGAIELVYGKHKLYITAEGYEAYSASFNVDYAYKIKEYTLKSEDGSSEAGSTAGTQATTGNRTTTEKSTESGDKKTEKTTENGSTQDGTTEKSTAEDGVKDVSAATGTKTDNKVTVTAPIGASIYFDGEYLGIAPMSFTKVTGSHIITLSKTGYLSKSYTVTFTDDGKDENLKYDELTLISSLISEGNSHKFINERRLSWITGRFTRNG